MKPLPWHSKHALPRQGCAEEALQLTHICWKGVATAAEATAQCASRELISAGGATEAEVNAARIERLQRAKLLCNDQRRMVGQHDAAGAHADGGGATGNVTDDHGSGGASHARDVVMLGHPVAVVAPLLRMLCQIQRMAEGLRGSLALQDRGQINYGVEEAWGRFHNTG